MDSPGDQLLAGPAFSGYQNRAVIQRYFSGQLKDRLDGIALSDHIVKTEVLLYFLDPLFQLPIFFFQGLPFLGFFEDQTNFIRLERFGYKVVCAQLHGLDSHIDGAIG